MAVTAWCGMAMTNARDPNRGGRFAAQEKICFSPDQRRQGPPHGPISGDDLGGLTNAVRLI